MNSFDIIIIALGAFNILTGLASLVTGKLYMMGSSAAKYTDESLARYARPNGLMSLLTGIGLVALHLIKTELKITESFHVEWGLVILVAACAVTIVIYLANRKVLVRK